MSTLTKMNHNGHGQLANTMEDDFQILDPRSANGVAAMSAKPRMNAIATISAGFRNEKGYPDRSKNGEIYVHGDAPNLQQALEANGGKFLTVMFTSNSPKEFIQQRFVKYSASALLAYGDEDEITVITGETRTPYRSGSAEYANAIADCRVSVSVYFTLAEWQASGARMVFQDGLGLYRLRFTSINSLHSILSSIQYIKKMTGGYIAGIPFDLFLRNEEHAAADRKRRGNWIWQAVPRPPQGVTLDAQQFRAFADYGQSQMELLQLTAPQPETIDDAIGDVESITTTGDEAIEDEVIESESTPDPEPAPAPAAPALCDARDYQKKYFAIAGQTSYASDEGRAQFVMAMTKGKIKSLSKVLSTMTTEQADAFMDELKMYVEKEIKAKCQKAAAPAAAAQPARPKQAGPLDKHRKKIISQAKGLWGDDYRTKLEAELGQPNFNGMDAGAMNAVIARFSKMIEEKNAAAAAPREDLELTPDDDGVPPLNDPLSKAVRAKREAAVEPSDDDNPFDSFDVDENGEVIE